METLILEYQKESPCRFFRGVVRFKKNRLRNHMAWVGPKETVGFGGKRYHREIDTPLLDCVCVCLCLSVGWCGGGRGEAGPIKHYRLTAERYMLQDKPGKPCKQQAVIWGREASECLILGSPNEIQHQPSKVQSGMSPLRLFAVTLVGKGDGPSVGLTILGVGDKGNNNTGLRGCSVAAPIFF